MMVVLFATAWSLAQEPDASASLGGDDVQVEVVGTRWRIEVRGRVVEVEVPRSEDDRALIEALVESLLSELSLDASAPAPAAPPPPPRWTPPRTTSRPAPPTPTVLPRPIDQPAHAEGRGALQPLPPEEGRIITPTLDRPFEDVPSTDAPRWQLWAAGGVTFRADVAPSGVPSVGVAVGRTGGARARVSLDLPRTTAFVDASTLSAVRTDLAAWWSLGPVKAEMGAGIALRTYGIDGQPRTRHAVPMAVAGLGWLGHVGPLTISPWVGASVDGGVTVIRVPDGTDPTLSPFTTWAEIRIGWRP